MKKNSEPLSDHPLFRALVLMGGGLALGCGGVARTDPSPNPIASSGGGGSNDLGGSTAGGSGSNSVGGSTAGPGGSSAIIVPDPVPPITTGGNANAGGGAALLPDCPTEQYSCAGFAQAYCAEWTEHFDLSAELQKGSCVCDSSRPTSVKDCKSGENLVCFQGYVAGIDPGNWDRQLHVQCSCIPSPVPATYEDCMPDCVRALPGVNTNRLGCHLPSPCTYDASGVCTATSADVLYQDGIMCGCADIALK